MKQGVTPYLKGPTRQTGKTDGYGILGVYSGDMIHNNMGNKIIEQVFVSSSHYFLGNKYKVRPW